MTQIALSLDDPVDLSPTAKHNRLWDRVFALAEDMAIAKSRLRRRLAAVMLRLPPGESWCTACGGVAGVEGHNVRCSINGEREYRAAAALIG